MKKSRLRTQAFPVIILWMTAAALAGASGCGKQAEEPSAGTSDSLTAGYVKIGSESDWRIACNRSLDEAFTKENGFYLLINDAQQKPEKQVKAMREFISMGVDYILLDPLMETGWEASLGEAREAGIPVIIFDRKVENQSPEVCSTWIGSNFYLEGQRACAWLEAFLEKEDYDKPVNIIHLQGTIGSTAQIGRTNALMEAVSAHPGWKLLDQESGEFTTAKGKEVMADMLKQYGGQVQVVYCENDNMAYGAIEAIRESGRIPGTDIEGGEILILSFDAAKNALEKTRKGEIAVDTECMPLYGPLLVQLIQEMETGKEPDFQNYVAEEQFSAVEEISSVSVSGTDYPVTFLTEELIENREY